MRLILETTPEMTDGELAEILSVARTTILNWRNGFHGVNSDTVPRTGNAVKQALLHPAGAGSTDQKIAKHVGVDPKTVGTIRNELTLSLEIPEMDTRTGERNGKTYQQNTANIGNHRAQTIKMTGSGFAVVKTPPPASANCASCRFFEMSPDNLPENITNRLGFGICDADGSQKAGLCAACDEWEVYVPDEPIVTDTEPPKNVPLEDCEFWEPSSIRGPRGPYEKTRDAVRILFHLKNPELAACELRNTCDYKYMTAVWSAYKKLISDPE
jgi:DNA-binding XRE family transcriptional regulator